MRLISDEEDVDWLRYQSNLSIRHDEGIFERSVAQFHQQHCCGEYSICPSDIVHDARSILSMGLR